MSIVAAGIALRLAALVLLRAQPLHDDAADYEAMAQAWAHEGSWGVDWPPGVPMLLRAAHALFGPSPLVARAAMLPLYLVLSLVVLRLAMDLYDDRRIANGALAILALMPTQILHSIEPLTHLPAAVLLVTSVWLALGARTRPNVALLGGLGLALALLVLVRPAAATVAAALPIWVLLRTRRPAALLVPGALCALVVGGWVKTASTHAGHFVFVSDSNAQNLFYGNNQWTPLYKTWWFGSHKAGEPGVPDAFVDAHREIIAAPPSERNHRFTHAALEHITAHPGLFVVRSLARVRAYLAFDSYTASFLRNRVHASWAVAGPALAADAALYLFVAGFVFAFVCAVRPLPTEVWLLLGIALLYAAPYFVAFSHPTYHFELVPLFAPLAVAQAIRRTPIAAPRTFWIGLFVLAAIQIEFAAAMLA